MFPSPAGFAGLPGGEGPGVGRGVGEGLGPGVGTGPPVPMHFFPQFHPSHPSSEWQFALASEFEPPSVTHPVRVQSRQVNALCRRNLFCIANLGALIHTSRIPHALACAGIATPSFLKCATL